MRNFLHQVAASVVALVAIFVLVVGGDAAAAAVGGWGGGLSQAVADTIYCNLTASSCAWSGTGVVSFAQRVNLRNAQTTILSVGTAGTGYLQVTSTGVDLAAVLTNTSLGTSNFDGPIGLAERTGAAPTTVVTCAAAAQGAIQYVDDTNDTAAGFLCFCGKGADDSTYSWQKVAAPGTSCGPF